MPQGHLHTALPRYPLAVVGFTDSVEELQYNAIIHTLGRYIQPHELWSLERADFRELLGLDKGVLASGAGGDLVRKLRYLATGEETPETVAAAYFHDIDEDPDRTRESVFGHMALALAKIANVCGIIAVSPCARISRVSEELPYTRSYDITPFEWCFVLPDRKRAMLVNEYAYVAAHLGNAVFMGRPVELYVENSHMSNVDVLDADGVVADRIPLQGRADITVCFEGSAERENRIWKVVEREAAVRWKTRGWLS